MGGISKLQGCLGLLGLLAGLACCQAPGPVPASSANSCPVINDTTLGLATRYTGKVWKNWVPVFNYSYVDTSDNLGDQILVVSNQHIPDSVQGTSTPGLLECNTKCCAVSTCVGYTWLGGKYKQCWLHSQVAWFLDPVDSFADPTKPLGKDSTPVPSDTVLARVARGAASWPACPSTTDWTVYAQRAFVLAQNTRLTSTGAVIGSQNDCNQACGNDPGCVAYFWDATVQDQKFTCRLLSGASGLTFQENAFTKVRFSAPLQACLPPAVPSLPPPLPPAPSEASDYTAGVQHQGVVWPGFKAAKRAGWVVSDGSDPKALTWSNNYIPDDVQGQSSLGPADCNQKCVAVDNCVGYTWLGNDGSCWLHSWIQFWAQPSTTFEDSNRTTHVVEQSTVLGRVVNNVNIWDCSGIQAFPKQAIVANSSTKVTRKLLPAQPFVWQACNQVCAQDPSCLAFSWVGPDLNASVACTMYSATMSGLAFSSDKTGISFVAPLQPCTELFGFAQQKAYPAALKELGLSLVALAIQRAGLADVLGPKFTGVVLAPSDVALGQAISQNVPALDPSQAGAIFQYHVLPNATLPTSSNTTTTSPSLLAKQPVQMNADTSNVTRGLTYYFYGTADNTVSCVAATDCVQFNKNATLCKVEGVLRAPVGAPTIYQYIRNHTELSSLKSMVDSVPALVAMLNDTSQNTAIFAPNNEAMNAFLDANPNLTPDIIHSVLLGHISAAPQPFWNAGAAPGTVISNVSTRYKGDNGNAGNILTITQGRGVQSNPAGGNISVIVPFQSTDGYAGKSLVHVITGVLDVGVAGVDVPQDASGGLLSSASGAAKVPDKVTLPTGALVGIVVGAVLLCAVVGIALCTRGFRTVRRKHFVRFGGAGSLSKDMYSIMATDFGKHTPMDVPGLAKGEIFTRATAYEYAWQMTPLDENQIQAVEAGINDKQLDAMNKDDPNPLPPVVELSKDDLRKQVQLVHGGLLGRGATALVFQCVWPSRFGSNALLAAKVLKDGHEIDPLVLQSFAYEANVLASTEHPCVVRLYGYCLEPPTVCLILELLPYSLKDLLYGRKGHGGCSHLWPCLLKDNSASRDLPAETAVTAAHSCSRQTSSPGTSAGGSMPYQVEGPSDRQTRPSPECETASNSSYGTHKVKAMTECVRSPDAAGSKASPLSMLQVLNTSAEIAAGLAYLHDRQLHASDTSSSGHVHVTLGASHVLASTMELQGTKIVHRDLKPANILMNSQGRAKISDFGLARRTQRTTLHTERQGAGTIPYMAPELLVATGGGYVLAATNRVDVYSLSMIMWEMISGEQPWSDRGELAISTAVVGNQRPHLPSEVQKPSGAPPDVEQLPASLDASPEFNALIRAAWHQRDLKRPTAAALYQQLCELLRMYGHNPPSGLEIAAPS